MGQEMIFVNFNQLNAFLVLVLLSFSLFIGNCRPQFLPLTCEKSFDDVLFKSFDDSNMSVVRILFFFFFFLVRLVSVLNHNSYD